MRAFALTGVFLGTCRETFGPWNSPADRATTSNCRCHGDRATSNSRREFKMAAISSAGLLTPNYARIAGLRQE
jgi:hypothetical protein